MCEQDEARPCGWGLVAAYSHAHALTLSSWLASPWTTCQQVPGHLPEGGFRPRPGVLDLLPGSELSSGSLPFTAQWQRAAVSLQTVAYPG